MKYQSIQNKKYSDLLEESIRRPVILVFTADWLGASHILDTYIEELSAEYPRGVKFYRIDASSHRTISNALGIRQLPTTLILYHQEIIDLSTGLISKNFIRKKIDLLIK